MKDYINLFHSMVSEIHFWNINIYFTINILTFLDNQTSQRFLVDYFDNYRENLINNTFNFNLKGVITSIIMAVPKRKQSPSRTGMRRSQNMKFKSKNIVEDKKSGEYRLPHHLDLKTGMYRGRQILDPKD